MMKQLAATVAMLVTAAAVPVAAQTTVGGGAPAPYAPAGAAPAPGRTPSGLGSAATGTSVVPALPQPSTGVTPPIGAATAGTIGDGRVGTLAPGASTNPGVTGTTGLSPTSGVSPTTPTTNPQPR